MGANNIHIEKRRRSNDQGIESYYRERGKTLDEKYTENERKRNKKPFGVAIVRRS
jgi:hypothetical protein